MVQKRMGVNTQKFIRKPLYVDAVRVNGNNFDEIVEWCQGEVETDEAQDSGTTKKYIKVRVHNPKNPRQTKAFVGDWILYTERGYKVYTNKAFRGAFDEVTSQVTADEIREKLPNAQDKRPKIVIEETDEHNRVIDSHVEPIQSVRPGDDLGTTPQGEQIEVVEATPEAIADAVNEQQPVEPPRPGDEKDQWEDTPIAPPPTPAIDPPEKAPQPEAVLDEADADRKIEQAAQPEPVSEQPPRDPAAGKYVLSEKEQKDLGPEGVQELIRSGEAVLVQDLAESA